MAWFAVTSLMRTIELEFLQPYPRLVLDDTEAVEALHRRLAQLLAFLEESDSQLTDDDETTKDGKARIKDVALSIEDEIESEIIDIYGRQHTSRPFIGRLLKYTHHKRFHNTLLNAIECTGEFMELVKNKQPMKEVQIKDDIPSSSEKIDRGSGFPIHTASNHLQITMVGHHHELNMIKELLLQESWEERLVVPIVGMGGIGKTTFAKRLYEDPSVASHFDVVAWTTVSAQCDMRRTLLQLLSTMQITEEINNKSNEELADLLRKCLMGWRYLIVLDDLWSTSFWDEIQRCFPDNNNGSRILLTSRLQEVASYTRSHNYSLNMPLLNSDESWQLFYVRILNYGRLPMKLGGIWRHIVDYCKGLPLAIVIVAGLLQATNESLWESEEIEKILYATVSNNLSESISKILRLSYNHLPNFLKICFIYLGVFPEGIVILVKKLIRLWIAEGYVKVEDQRSLEEVAEDYLKDLVSRSLVLIDSFSLDGKIKSCKVHDIVHDFCRNEAMKEGLLHVASTFIGMLPNLQVLKLKDGACQGQNWEVTDGSFSRLKSLLICGSDLMNWEATSNGFPVLERLVLKVCYHLEAIPSSFGDVPTLQLIELSHCYSPLVNSAKQIQEVQRDYGNNALVVRAYNIWRIVEEELEEGR